MIFFRQNNELERDYLKDKYFETVKDLKRHLNFFDCLDYCTGNISVIEKTISWTKIENQEVYQTFPHLKPIIIGQEGSQILATPIKKTSLSDEHKNIDNIIQ